MTLSYADLEALRHAKRRESNTETFAATMVAFGWLAICGMLVNSLLG